MLEQKFALRLLSDSWPKKSAWCTRLLPIVHKKQFAFYRARRCKRPHSTSDELTEHHLKAFEANFFLHQPRSDGQSGRAADRRRRHEYSCTRTTRGLTVTLGRHVSFSRNGYAKASEGGHRRRAFQQARRAGIVTKPSACRGFVILNSLSPTICNSGGASKPR